MEIKDMDLEQVETRMEEVKGMLHEDGADLEALETEIRSLKDRKQEINVEIEARKAEVAEVLNTATEVRSFEEERTRNTMENIEMRNSKEYIDAYAEYLKGDDKAVRSLLTENASGTVAVPELVYDIVRTAWEREGIIARVRKAYLKGNLKVGFEISATGAVVHTEGQTKPDEETLVLGTVNIIPKSIKKWITISDEVYSLRGEEFIRYIYDELTYQIAKKCADELVAKIIACGTVSTSTCPSVPVVNGALGIGSVASALAQLSDEASNPVVIMNKQTWGNFKQVAYTNGYAVDPFENLPVLFNNTIKAYDVASTNETFAIVGDLGEGALANFPDGEEINIKFDELSLAEYDLIKIVGREYVGLEVVAPKAFVKLTKN